MHTNATNTKRIIFKELSYKINGLCFQIHNKLGRFRNEKQYADALERALQDNNINYEREYALPMSFVGENRRRNVVDFLINSQVILEIKAKRFINREDYFQIQRYLESSNKSLGIIVNFGQKYLAPKRVIKKDS